MTDNLPTPMRVSKNQEIPPAPVDPPRQRKIRFSLKYRTIAEYAARGYSCEMIAKVVRMHPDSVRQILDKNEQVCELINKILSELFQEGDMILIHLYKKALQKLDAEMESTNPEIRHKAIEKVLKQAMLSAGKGEEGSKTLIAQFFGAGSTPAGGGMEMESLDDVILRKRKERGLE